MITQSGAGIKVEIQGVDALLATMAELSASLQRKGMRAAMTKATQPMLARVKSLCPTLKKKAGKWHGRTGLLKKSIKRTVKNRQNLTGVKCRIFADPKVDGYVQQANGEMLYVRPSKYIHLVERGHGGPHPAPAHPFMRPAFESLKDSAEATFASTLKTEVERIAKKGYKPYARKGPA